MSSLSRSTQENFPDFSCHCYADDTQLYLSFRPAPSTQDASVSLLEKCINFIRSWLLSNKLKLNDRVNFWLSVLHNRFKKISINGVRVGLSSVKPSDTARNLGVYFDTNLNMETQVTKICKSTYYLLYNLRRIRKYFDQESMKLVVHALISSKLDYCNGLLFGMPDSLISR